MWPYPKMIAHRGGGKLAPENTIAALRCGLAHGFSGVEFDVMLAKDGVPIVMHDPQLGRTVTGSGSVADYTAAELMQMDAGAWFDQAYAGEKVPSFEQVVAFCRANAIWMNIEIKPVPGFEEATGRVVAQTTERLFADVLALQRSEGKTMPRWTGVHAPFCRCFLPFPPRRCAPRNGQRRIFRVPACSTGCRWTGVKN